jgi:branched-chain amino acid transport system ATP-binding protein
MLKVRDLCASYGGLRVLAGISLDVGKGELVSVIGPNGAGKTSLLRALSRLIGSEGTIEFDGRSTAGLAPQDVVGAGMALCPEGRQLFADMSVLRNLELGAFLRRDRIEVRKDLEKIYELLPVLYERRTQRAGTMSGGEQQMLAIGRALMSRPRFLMLDEPSFGIAPIMIDRIFDVIRRLNEDGLTTLVVEQNVGLALSVATRTYVIENGRVAHSGRSDEIMSNEDVRRVYLGL